MVATWVIRFGVWGRPVSGSSSAGVAQGWSEVGLVAGLTLAALLAVAGVGVVRGDQRQPARREPLFGCLPPDHLLPVAVDNPVVLLYPDPAESLDRGQLPQPRRGIRGVHRPQQPVAVPAVGHDQRVALGLALGQVQLIDPAPVHPRPRVIDHSSQPPRSRGGERLQRRTDALPDQLQPVQAAQTPQHMGGVGALPPARAHQSQPRQPDQQGIERLGLHRPRAQPGTELTEHREVEPRILQRQPERVLPVDRPPHHVGRLTVGQVLRHRQHQHDHQLGRGDPRFAAHPEQALEPLIRPHLTQLIADADRQAVPGERGPGGPGGVGGHLWQPTRLKRHDTLILRPRTGKANRNRDHSLTKDQHRGGWSMSPELANRVIELRKLTWPWPVRWVSVLRLSSFPPCGLLVSR